MKTILVTTALIFAGILCFSQQSRRAEDAKGLLPGAKAPAFKALDADSIIFNLAESLKSGPVVLIFYRGFWCPVCNKHLATVQDSLNLITQKGATVVAVSPEKKEYLRKMEQTSGAKFRLLYDEGYKIANAYDVTFTPGNSELFIYNNILRAKLKETHSGDSQQLPIPATYLIGSDGKIVWRQFDPNYKHRSTVKDIIQAIDGLKK